MTEIKQYSPNDNVILVPRAARKYVVKQNPDGSYITGLTPEQEQRLGKVMGKDLTPFGDFWDTYTMEFYLPQRTMQVDETRPLGEIFLATAKANKLLAEDEDELASDMTLKKNTIFYVHDVKKLEQKKAKLTEIKDEVSAIIYQMRNNKDKMLFLCFKLGKFVTSTLKAETLYNLLSNHKEKLVKYDQFEKYREALNTSNEELQAFYYVKTAFKHSIILIDPETRVYKFQDKIVGDTEAKVVKFFSEKKNELLLVGLINEVKEKIE